MWDVFLQFSEIMQVMMFVAAIFSTLVYVPWDPPGSQVCPLSVLVIAGTLVWLSLVYRSYMKVELTWLHIRASKQLWNADVS